MTKALILVSDLKLSTVLKMVLTFNRFNTQVASSVTLAKKALEEVKYNVIIIDIHFQQENAFRFVRGLRERGIFTPVLFLGERAYQDAMLVGCTGLDEYLLKPFTFNDLKTKLNKLLDKFQSEKKPLLYSGIDIDIHKRLLYVKDKFVELGKMEMRILLLLAKKAGSVVHIDKVQTVLDDDGTRYNTTVFTHISVLRKKLAHVSGDRLQINFVKDGYRLEVA